MFKKYKAKQGFAPGTNEFVVSFLMSSITKAGSSAAQAGDSGMSGTGRAGELPKSAHRSPTHSPSFACARPKQRPFPWKLSMLEASLPPGVTYLHSGEIRITSVREFGFQKRMNGVGGARNKVLVPKTRPSFWLQVTGKWGNWLHGFKGLGRKGNSVKSLSLNKKYLY